MKEYRSMCVRFVFREHVAEFHHGSPWAAHEDDEAESSVQQLAQQHHYLKQKPNP